MDDLGAVSDDQVILSWLQAEIESPPFQSYLIGDPPKPSHLARAVALAQNPDLGNTAQNAERRRIIASAHGFGRGALIFAGLADDVAWRRFRVSVSDVGEMFYSNRNAAWTTLAPATRKVAEGAANAGQTFAGDATNMHILALSELICLRLPDGGISVVEGHARATAIVIEAHRLHDGVEAYIGDSPSIDKWAYV
jgi:hypothetical protein